MMMKYITFVLNGDPQLVLPTETLERDLEVFLGTEILGEKAQKKYRLRIIDDCLDLERIG